VCVAACVAVCARALSQYVLTSSKSMCVCVNRCVCCSVCCSVRIYGVATIGRLLQIIGLFCRIRLFYRALWQKRPNILRSLLIVATPCKYSLPHARCVHIQMRGYVCIYTRIDMCIHIQVYVFVCQHMNRIYAFSLPYVRCLNLRVYGYMCPCTYFNICIHLHVYVFLCQHIDRIYVNSVPLV